MVDSIKSNLFSVAGTIASQKTPALSSDAPNFGDFLKTDMKQFLKKSHEVDAQMVDYISGVGDIEELAPKLKELMLEFEVKTKIISSLANIIKSLTSMNI